MKRILCLALLVTGCIKADTFKWSYNSNCLLCGPFVDANGNPVNNGGTPATLFVLASGTFTTTNTPVNGALTILAVTGTRTTNWFMNTYLHPAETDKIGMLLPVDPTNPYNLAVPPDNLLYPNGPNFLDVNGVAFTMNCGACGTYGFANIVQLVSASVLGVSELGPTDVNGSPGYFTLTLTPEPATLLLLLPPAILTIVVRLRRLRTTAVPEAGR